MKRSIKFEGQIQKDRETVEPPKSLVCVYIYIGLFMPS